MKRLLCAVLALALATPAAAGTVDGTRKVAVLEYRAGSSALPRIDRRLAGLLGSETSLDVIDADEARKKYGNKLDADVVACAGEAECIAKIGGKLGAKEVLLVGVSEFGNVILTMQRIDVHGRSVSMRIAEALGEDDDPADDALTGYLKRVMPESDFLQYGTIKISANLTGAEVFLGKERRGTTPIDSIQVRAPATYELRVTKHGYVPFTMKVAVPPQGEVEVSARMTREGAGGKWYTSWWAAAIAGVVVAGGIGVGVLVSETPPTSVPASGTVH